MSKSSDDVLLAWRWYFVMCERRILAPVPMRGQIPALFASEALMTRLAARLADSLADRALETEIPNVL